MSIKSLDVICILTLWLIMWLFNLLEINNSRWPRVKNALNVVVMILLIIVLILYLMK
jgi:hypothetical protein